MHLVHQFMEEIKKFHFQRNDNVDNPISIYAASKKSNELMANVYNNLFTI